MEVYTDNPEFAAIFLQSGIEGTLTPLSAADLGPEPFLRQVFGSIHRVRRTTVPESPWPHLLLSEFSEGSQYDLFIEWVRNNTPPPHGFLAVAGSGSGFHGFKDRSWQAEPGNLHVVLHLSPQRAIERFEVAFTVLATLSVVDALAQIAGLEGAPTIKWVNDVLLGGGKVGGVLAFTQTQGQTVSSAILGIGLNVETVPDVASTPFVPRVTSVREFVGLEGPDLRKKVLDGLLLALKENYRILLEEGAGPLVQRYREQTAIIGRDVSVYSDHTTEAPALLARGRVRALGDNLELYLDQEADPITTGRLVLDEGKDESKNKATGAGEFGLASRGATRIGL